MELQHFTHYDDPIKAVEHASHLLLNPYLYESRSKERDKILREISNYLLVSSIRLKLRCDTLTT